MTYWPCDRALAPPHVAGFQRRLRAVSTSACKKNKCIFIENWESICVNFIIDFYLEIVLNDGDGTGGLADQFAIWPPRRLSTIVKIFPSISLTWAQMSRSTLSSNATPPLDALEPIVLRFELCSESSEKQKKRQKCKLKSRNFLLIKRI